MNTPYTPAPADTSAITLSPELLELTERVAANVHDVWAAARIAAGWQYGPTRDDAKKLHPCLVPYGELPESEKTYDRNTAVETLKMVLLFGFKIERSDHDRVAKK